MDNSHDASGSAAEQLATVHLPVRHSEENKSEEGVEGSTQQTQEVAHAGNNLRKDEGDGPDTCHDGNPDSPADDSVGMGVTGLAHDAVVHELCGHVRIDHTDNQRGNNDKGKRSLLVCHDTKTAESRGGGVLSEVSEADGRRNDEQESGNTCQNSQRLGEVLRPLHLGDESREQDLRHPQKCNVKHGIHTRNPSRSSRREGVCLDGTSLGISAVVAVSRSILNTSKDQEEQNGNTHASSTEHTHKRDMLECTRDRHDDTHNGHDDREDDSTHTVITERIENLCSRQDVEANKQDIVGQ